jgi:hypothetical protein
MALIAHYKLDGDATDSSGNGYNGTATNVTYVTGQIGQAGSFNGSSSQIVGTTLGNFGSTATAFTIAMWVKPATTGLVMPFGSFFGSGTKLYSWINYGNSTFATGRLEITCANSSNVTRSASVDSNTGVSDGSWHHVAFAINLATDSYAIYVDAVSKTVVKVATAISAFGANLQSAFNLGYFSGTPGLGRYNGLIDDLRVYDTQFTAGEVLSLYSGSSPLLKRRRRAI